MAKNDQKQVFLFFQHLIVDYSCKLLMLKLIFKRDIKTTFPESNYKFEYDWTLHLPFI